MNDSMKLVDEVRFLILTRKIKIIGGAIAGGLVMIFLAGLFVAENNIDKDLALLNLTSVILCPILCITSVYIRKARLKKVNRENFNQLYTGVYIVAFAMCDLGGIFCITTNLFINYNLIYAIFGLLVSVLYILINFPKTGDLNNINNFSKVVPE